MQAAIDLDRGLGNKKHNNSGCLNPLHTSVDRVSGDLSKRHFRHIRVRMEVEDGLGSHLLHRPGARSSALQLCKLKRPNPSSRANSTKIPSPRIDLGGQPTDPGWRGKEGTASGIKNNEGAQSLGKKTITFFPWRHTTAARRETRMAEVEIRRSEAGRATEPIAQIRPAIGMRAGR